MIQPIPYNTTKAALLRPAKNAVFFDGWEEKDFGNYDLLCAEMSRLAYAPFNVVKDTLASRNFSLVTFIGGDDAAARVRTDGTQAFVASSKARGVTVLAFRGTQADSPEDLIADLLTLQDADYLPGCRVHTGFAKCYRLVAKDVANALA